MLLLSLYVYQRENWKPVFITIPFVKLGCDFRCCGGVRREKTGLGSSFSCFSTRESSSRKNWVRQFLFLFLNSGEFLNTRTENRFNQIKPNNFKESHLTYFNQTSLFLNQLLCNPSPEYNWGEGWPVSSNPRMRLIHLKRIPASRFLMGGTLFLLIILGIKTVS